MRRVDFDPLDEQDRKDAALAENEVGVLPKVIGTNIRAQHPAILQFLTQPANIVWFKSMSGHRALGLEEWFNRVARVPDWHEPFMQAFDAAAEHGIGWMRVAAEPATPLGFAPRYVPNVLFAFPKGCKDIQRAAMVGYGVDLSIPDLRLLAQSQGFVPEWESILQISPQTELQEYKQIWHMYYRASDLSVWCFWFDGKKMLSKPKQFQFYVNADGTTAPCPDYPFFALKYNITSEEDFDMFQGRADLDGPQQIAVQALQTAGVNGAILASRFFPTMDKKEDMDFVQSVVLEPYKLSNKLITTNQLTYPPMHVFEAARAIRMENTQDAGHMDLSVTSQGYRKSAKEVQLASNISSGQDALLTAPLSSTIVAVYTAIFLGVQQHYSSGFKKVAQLAAIEPLAAQELLNDSYVLCAAGAEEYLKREALLAAIEQSFGLVASNPVISQLLQEEYLTIRFPHLAGKLKAALDNQPIISALIETVRASADSIPEHRNELLDFADQASARLLGVAPSSSDRTSPPTNAPTDGEPPTPSGGSNLRPGNA